MEIAHAYECLRQSHHQVSLTIITATHMVRPADVAYLRSLPGLNLVEAKLSAEAMSQMYRNHDLFVLPTMREGFGLVLIEAIAYGIPLIVTDQYATSEMAIDGFNAFVYPNHPLKDYDPKTYKLLGRYYNPRDFYADLFKLQREGKLIPLEIFLVSSVERFITNPKLMKEFSQHSLDIYSQKFNFDKLSQKIETVFLEAMNKTASKITNQAFKEKL